MLDRFNIVGKMELVNETIRKFNARIEQDFPPQKGERDVNIEIHPEFSDDLSYWCNEQKICYSML